MDLFLEGCQGVGLALAAGALAGALAGAAELARLPTAALGAIALVAGALLFGWSLTEADHPAWPGWPIGVLLALASYLVVGAVVSGARRRAAHATDGGGGSAGVLALAALGALLLAGLALLVSPVSLAALAGIAWLGLARRRRAGEKYEGLRVLR